MSIRRFRRPRPSASLSYLDTLITEREKDAETRDDLLSRLIVEQVRPGHLSHRELVVMAELLLMAGHETTANQMALGVYSFLTNPDQLALAARRSFALARRS